MALKQKTINLISIGIGLILLIITFNYNIEVYGNVHEVIWDYQRKQCALATILFLVAILMNILNIYRIFGWPKTSKHDRT